MWRSLLTDLESVLKGAKPADLIRVLGPVIQVCRTATRGG